MQKQNDPRADRLTRRPPHQEIVSAWKWRNNVKYFGIWLNKKADIQLGLNLIQVFKRVSIKSSLTWKMMVYILCSKGLIFLLYAQRSLNTCCKNDIWKLPPVSGCEVHFLYCLMFRLFILLEFCNTSWYPDLYKIWNIVIKSTDISTETEADRSFPVFMRIFKLIFDKPHTTSNQKDCIPAHLKVWAMRINLPNWWRKGNHTATDD